MMKGVLHCVRGVWVRTPDAREGRPTPDRCVCMSCDACARVVFDLNLIASTTVDANGGEGVDVVLAALELNGGVCAVDARHFDSCAGVPALEALHRAAYEHNVSSSLGMYQGSRCLPNGGQARAPGAPATN